MSVVMHWPQIVMIAILAVGSGIYLARHGQPQTGTYSIWVSLVSDAIVLSLLYYGGFFAGASQ